MQSNSTKLIGESNDAPIDVDGEYEVSVLREENSDDDEVRLSNIPVAAAPTRPKRQRNNDNSNISVQDPDEDDEESAIEIDSDADEPASKRARLPETADEDDLDGEDDKKKLAMDVSYEGFAIYGRVLCLVVRKRENKTQRSRQEGTSSAINKPEGQANMENWITSTQIPVGEEVP